MVSKHLILGSHVSSLDMSVQWDRTDPGLPTEYSLWISSMEVQSELADRTMHLRAVLTWNFPHSLAGVQYHQTLVKAC